MKTLIKNAKVVRAGTGRSRKEDILIEAGKIIDIATAINPEGIDKIIDAAGKIVLPMLIDMHVHLREPGREDKEEIKTGTRAALAGGIGSVLAMPNTEPAIDSRETVKYLKRKIKQEAFVDVFLSAAITKGRKGKELGDIERLAKEGIKAITDDGDSVDNSQLMLEALKQAKKNNITVICHSEDKTLSKRGVLNLGFSSTCLGLRGIPKSAEFMRVARDIKLAKKADAKIHIAHVSCKESIEIIAKAKKKGVQVTAETAPHYFSLSEKDLWSFDTNKKINPPLRNQEDILAIKQALADGVIDVIASDHAPHTENEKDIEFQRAEFGTIGLETELSVAFTELIKKKFLSWQSLLDKFITNPAEILEIKKKSIKVGADADLIIFNPDKEWVVSKENFYSKSKNSCFLGRKLQGKIEKVFHKGKQF
ncbi:MAG: dihydroorotase [Candidatus Omnitrophica bacterium]|nr:dihydroorotase [Candidatus Omnitrophota bacterium]MCF7893696.1 dihydroorotase [Candidatus Omnitrophota bacterium]